MTPTGDGDVRLRVAADAVTDAAGNGNAEAPQFTSTFVAPRVTITGVPPISIMPFTATITFDEAVTGFVRADIMTVNAMLSNFTEVTENTVWTVLVTPTADGEVTLDIDEGAVTNIFGDRNTAAPQAMSTYDSTAPAVVSITRETPATSPTDADSLTWRVTFDEAVMNVDARDFTLVGTTATLSVGEVTGETGVWDVTAAGGNLAGLDGTVMLSLASGQDIADEAGNALTATMLTGANDDTDTYTVDNSAPGVTSITRETPSGSPTNADSLTWRVTFVEAVTNVDAMDFTVTETTATITNVVSVSGQTDIYDVTASGGDLTALNGTVTLSFASGQNIADEAGNALTATMPTGANENSYVVDNTAPMVGWTEPSSLMMNAFTEITPDTRDLDIANYSATGLPAGLNINMTTGLIQGRPTTASSSQSTVVVTVTDNAGNSAGVTLTFPAVVADTTEPRVVSITRFNPTAELTDADALTWRVRFSETVENVDATDFTVSGTMATLSVMEVTGETGVWDVTAMGDDLTTLNGTVTLSFASSQDIEDEAGNGLTATMPTGANENSYMVNTTAVSIAAGPPVSEGSPAVFMLTRTGTTTAMLTVNVSIIQTGDVISGTPPTEVQVMFEAGQATAMLRLMTVDDNVDEVDDPAGTITATLEPDSETPATYALGTPSSDTITVNDNDTRSITFAPLVLEISEGAESDYTVVLDTEPINTVMITPLSDNSDVTVTPAVLTFTPTNWDRPQTVTVTAARDDDDMDETVLITHDVGSPGADYDGLAADTVEITVSEPSVMKRTETVGEVLTGFVGEIVQQTVDVIQYRILSNRVPGFRGQVAGQAIVLREGGVGGQPDVPDGAGERLGYMLPDLSNEGRAAFLTLLEGGAGEDARAMGTSSQSLTVEEALTGTAFSVTQNTDSDLSFGLWGQASHSGFNRRSGTDAIDGRVTGVQLGTDWQRGNDLFGLMVSRSRSDVDVTGGDTSGEIEVSLTALVPYASRRVSSDLSFWGAAGFGRGELSFTQEGQSGTTDIDWKMLTGGAQGALGAAPVLGGASLELSVDALWTEIRSDTLPLLLNATRGQRTRLRFGLEALWAQALKSGAIQTPRLSLGMRHDGGDAETGLGVEIGGGLDWRDPSRGLSFGVEGRALALHEEDGVKDWGVLVSFDYDPRSHTQRGFAMAFTHNLGGSASDGVTALLGPETFPGASSTGGSDDGAWILEASYGMGRGGGMVGSPYGRLSVGSDRAQDVRLGYRIGPDVPYAAKIDLDLWAEPQTSAGGETRAGASLEWRW